MTIEPHLEGIWKRYTTNSSGLINAEKNAYIHAYSHFAYEYSMKNIFTDKLIIKVLYKMLLVLFDREYSSL